MTTYNHIMRPDHAYPGRKLQPKKRSQKLALRRASGKFVPVSRVAELIHEALEDTRLNAIADERAEGPFVEVSLDDL